MLFNAFLLHLVLAFVVGSVWVFLVTTVSERSIEKGGILAGLPSTSAFSFLFIGINQSSAAAVQATTVFPLVFSFTCVFLLLYFVFTKHGFIFGLSISLLIWLGISTVVVFLGLDDFLFSIVCGVLISAIPFYFYVGRLKLKVFSRQERKHWSYFEILLKGLGAGALITLAVYLSQIGGPVIGGIASAFPAVFSSTLIILKHTKNLEYSRSETKPMAIAGVLTIIPFSVLVRYLFPVLGVWEGTLVAYGLVVPLAGLAFVINKRTNKLRAKEFE